MRWRYHIYKNKMENKIDLTPLLPKGVKFEPAFGSEEGYQRFRERFIKSMKEDREYGDPPTVAEVIEILKEMPQDFPCYFRPKYHGDVKWCDDVPLNGNGICEMHPEGKPKNVTFLC